MLDAGTLSYDQVYLQSLTAKSAGKLKLAQGGLGWKESSTAQVTTLASADFSSIAWFRAMRGYELRIYLKDGSVHKFDGLPAEALEELKDFVKEHYQVPFETKELSVKGWNWGKAEIDGNHLEFKVGDRMAFDLPLKEVTNAVVTIKDEIAIEFSQPENVDKKTDTLVEMRLYVPGNESDSAEEGDEGLDAAKSLCEKIKGFSEMNQVTGEVIVSLPELPCIVPRGRFQMDMTPSYLRLHGKSYDHKILYSSIVKLFLLPKADEMHVLFVLALDPPIRQGQTRYPFLVFQFNKDEEIEVALQNIDEETIKSKYEGKLQMQYDAPTFEVVSTLFRLLAGQKIIVPGSFRSQGNGNSIKCAFKANEGFLYPLERNILFLPKPVTLIPNGEISHVEFARMGSGSGNPRSFDLKFYLKSGQDVSFSNIAKEEYQFLEDFLKQKNIDFRSKDEDEGRRKKVTKEFSDSEDEAAVKRMRMNGDDESSPDEDYDDGGDESSVGEEYDEDFNSDEDSNEEEGSESEAASEADDTATEED
ncbi:High mobility group (HMG) box domain-containing protein [Paramicrosporidium saccamoebae]|uniref:FACT complex subunit POB3 n=1 Tax=Paramicrosporidium saccamoebae TaxID=1246581 RepID=A0A2H9TIY1_9FUNG|nr:High mobility group (HMG) box domain-containing protein [Paramicrosporidium saccamoebae]